MKKFQAIFVIALMSLVPTILLWAPFFLRLPEFWSIPLPTDGMATIVRNYDGPLYIVVAKSFYNISLIKNFSFTLPVEYYAAHFPFFPVLIRLLAFIVGFPWGMLIVTLLSSIFAIYYFYLFIAGYVKKEHVLWITATFSIFPARWLIVRSVGSPEPLFVGAVIASIYYFQKKRYWLAGIFGVIAQLTKSPGILLFIAYAGFILGPWVRDFATAKNFTKWMRKLNAKAFPVLLIPASLLLVFYLYGQTFNDFWAYFHSGDNIHLLFPPFQIFDYSQPWVETFWLEEIIFFYLVGAMGLAALIKQKRYDLAWFVGVYFFSIIFVSHRDIMRYSLPIIPFLYVAFSDLLTKKEFKFVLIFLLLPIYLFSLAYISQNVMPVADWAPLL